MSAVQRRDPAAVRVALVTGASSGIGRATAARLADAGQVVFAAARRAPALESLAQEHPNVRPIVMDVTDPASIDGARQQVQATGDGGLDLLVNAAGTMLLGPAAALPDEQLRAQFDVNLFGLLAVTRAFVPAMRERGAGRIVNLSSTLGRFVLPGTGLYSASKFAVEAYSDALRMELAPYGILVVLVEPGVTDTSLYESASASLSGYTQALEPYRSTWAGGFEFPQRLLKSAATVDSVTADVVKAALATNPRPRYRPGIRNRMRTRLLTTLQTRMADRIKQRLAGLSTAPQPVTWEATRRWVPGKDSPTRRDPLHTAKGARQRAPRRRYDQ
jgi:NAD(P)-dependent dehydrogenase (short-subunit alcohol dehydrogenase family)